VGINGFIDLVVFGNVADVIARLFEANDFEQQIGVLPGNLLPFQGISNSAVICCKRSGGIAVEVVKPLLK